VQQEIGDYPAATASQRQALALFRDLGDQLGQAEALNDLGVVQQETGDYAAATASHQRALVLFRDLGDQLGQAQALNRLGAVRPTPSNCERTVHTAYLTQDHQGTQCEPGSSAKRS
jgi:tetratricopeptide (TPR) repeat protein